MGVAIGTKTSHKSTRIYYLVILVFSFALYGNSIRNGYALDDNYVTATGPRNPNPKIQAGIAGIPNIFTSYYFESGKQNFEYRPVVLTSFALEYQFFGSDPQVSHFVNVLLYALTCVVLFTFLRKLFVTRNPLFPFLVTIIFLAHPIHTEVVDNLKSRDELLAFLLGLLSLKYFLAYAGDKKLRNLVPGMVLFLLALLCKKTAVLFLAMLPLVLYFFSGLGIKRILWLAAAPTLTYVVYFLLRRFLVAGTEEIREYAFFENPLFYQSGVLNKLPMVFYTLGYYIRLLVFPHPLSCYYGYETIPLASWSMLFVWVSLIFYLFLAWFAGKGLPQKKMLSFAILVYLLGIVPFAQLRSPVVGIVGERFIYFSSFGFSLALVGLAYKAFKYDPKDALLRWRHLRPAMRIATASLLLVYSVKVIARNPVWKDELTLFRHDVKNHDNSCNLHYITANALARRITENKDPGNRGLLVEEAIRHYRMAAHLMAAGLDKFPADYITLNNLGTIYVDVFHDPLQAQPLFKRVKSIKPSNLEGQYNYAFCFEKRNMPDSAIHEYEKLVAANSKYLPVYQRLHELYAARKQYGKAIEADKLALTIDSTRVDIYINLGNAYILSGDTARGLHIFEVAAQKAPHDALLMQKIATVFQAVGDSAKAREYESRSFLK